MAAEYKLVIKSTAGVKRAELVGTAAGGTRSGFLWLAYVREVNAPGVIRFGLDADSDTIDLLEPDGQVEVWRRDRRAGIPWGTEITGLYRAWRYEPDVEDESDDDLGDSNEVFVATCPGVPHLLSRRVNAYPADTTNRSAFANIATETIMRSLVQYNCTAAATTADGRIRTPAVQPISIETDQARGTVISRGNSGVNLLEELQQLARLGGVDFDLVRTGDAAWVFRVYGVRGADRRDDVTLSRENGTLNVLQYERDTIEEKTVAVIAGQGEGAAREFAVRTGATYSSAQDIETWVDARDVANGSAALLSRGDQALSETAALDRFDLQVIQAPSALYGLHYTLGDLLPISYRGIVTTRQVATVTVSLDETGDEAIDVELRER